MPADAKHMPPETATIPHTTIKTTTDVEYVVVNDDELEKPYRVIIENDDITPMEFVIVVLWRVFKLPPIRARAIMLEAHTTGHALVATMPFREAQERVYLAQGIARDNGYPLSFYLEPDV